MQARLLSEASLASSWFTPSGAVAVTAACAVIVSEIIKHYRDKKKDSATSKAGDPEATHKQVVVDEGINALIGELRYHCKACRVIIYLFHNGEKFLNTGPIQRMSSAYESVQGGIAKIAGDQKGIVTSMMSGFLSKMYDDTPLIIRTTELSDAYCKTTLDDLSVTHFACIPLHQSIGGERKIIGCLQVHWFTHNDENPDSPSVDNEEFKTWFDKEISTSVHRIQHKLAQRLEYSGTHNL